MNNPKTHDGLPANDTELILTFAEIAEGLSYAWASTGLDTADPLLSQLVTLLTRMGVVTDINSASPAQLVSALEMHDSWPRTSAEAELESRLLSIMREQALLLTEVLRLQQAIDAAKMKIDMVIPALDTLKQAQREQGTPQSYAVAESALDMVRLFDDDLGDAEPSFTPATTPEPPPTDGRRPVDEKVYELLDKFLSDRPRSLEAIKDGIEERVRTGERKYGTKLMTHNGRSAAVDAYQEVIDLLFYFTQHLMEKGGEVDGGAYILAQTASAREIVNLLFKLYCIVQEEQEQHEKQ